MVFKNEYVLLECVVGNRRRMFGLTRLTNIPKNVKVLKLLFSHKQLDHLLSGAEIGWY